MVNLSKFLLADGSIASPLGFPPKFWEQTKRGFVMMPQDGVQRISPIGALRNRVTLDRDSTIVGRRKKRLYLAANNDQLSVDHNIHGAYTITNGVRAKVVSWSNWGSTDADSGTDMDGLGLDFIDILGINNTIGGGSYKPGINPAANSVTYCFNAIVSKTKPNGTSRYLCLDAQASGTHSDRQVTFDLDDMDTPANVGAKIVDYGYTELSDSYWVWITVTAEAAYLINAVLRTCDPSGNFNYDATAFTDQKIRVCAGWFHVGKYPKPLAYPSPEANTAYAVDDADMSSVLGVLDGPAWILTVTKHNHARAKMAADQYFGTLHDGAADYRAIYRESASDAIKSSGNIAGGGAEDLCTITDANIVAAIEEGQYVATIASFGKTCRLSCLAQDGSYATVTDATDATLAAAEAIDTAQLGRALAASNYLNGSLPLAAMGLSSRLLSEKDSIEYCQAALRVSENAY